MPHKLKKANAKKGGVTYSGADHSLWDDGELLRLCAAQLEQGEGEVGHLTPPSSAHASHTSSEAETPASTLSGESTASESGDSRRGGDKSSSSEGVGGKRARHSSLGAMTASLPKDVRALAESFYAAGYEAGKYAAKRSKKA